MFLGEKVEYVLRCADVTLLAVCDSASGGERVAEGAAVGLRIADGALSVLPEEGA